jgi:drug/metabolite transporter (DMT)-like permease
MNKMTNNNKALVCGLTAVLLWSSSATAFKLALRELDVLQLLLYASSCSAVALLLIVWRQGNLGLLHRTMKDRLPFYLLMGLINPLVYYLVLLRAYDLLPAQQAQAINYTWALTLALLAVPLLGQKLSMRDVFAALLGYLGVLIIATRGRLYDMQFDSLEGVFYALASTVFWALYWILNTRNSSDPVVSLCLNFLVAVPVAFLLCLVFSTPQVQSWPGLGAALYVGLFEMGVTFALWASALKLASSVARVGNLIFLSPLISLVLISSVLGEPIHGATLLGLGLIIPAVLIQQLQRPAQASQISPDGN